MNKEAREIHSAKKESVQTSKRNKNSHFRIYADVTSHPAVGEYCSLACSITSWLVRYHTAPVQKYENHVTTHCVCTIYSKMKFNTPCESATGKWSFIYEKSQNAQLCQSFFKQCREQYNITISMLGNGTSINVVAQYSNVHRNKILRQPTCFHHSLRLFAIVKEVANHMLQLLRNTVILISCIQGNRFRKAALVLRNIPSKRRITGQAVRNRLREINPAPTGLH